MELRAAVASDVGCVREHNEDAAWLDEAHRFFAVADGMGGHAAGEVASALAVETVRERLETGYAALAAAAERGDAAGEKEVTAALAEAVRAAHRALRARAEAEPEKEGMGTTLDVLLVAGGRAFLAHAGDGRAYRLRAGGAERLTADHTLTQALVDRGELTPEEARVTSLRSVLMNALGATPELHVDTEALELRAGDRLLLCSDGLHDLVSEEAEIAERVGEREPEAAIAALVELARERGGHDNITALLVEVGAAAGERA